MKESTSGHWRSVEPYVCIMPAKPLHARRCSLYKCARVCGHTALARREQQHFYAAREDLSLEWRA
eukprot:6097614-Amphidinium_carterae.1